jgi:hypothetical protein
MYHPQSNGAVQRTNTLTFEAIKKILECKKKGKWTEVLPKGSVESQHDSLQGNKFHTALIVVWG